MTQGTARQEPRSTIEWTAPPGRRPDEQEEQPRRRGPALRLRELVNVQVPVAGMAVTGAGVLGVVIAAVWWVAVRQPQVEVPNLVGSPRAAAEASLRDANLRVRGVYGEVSGEPVGTVLRTDPPAGTNVDRRAGVSLVLAVAGTVPPQTGGGPPATGIQPPIIGLDPPAAPGGSRPVGQARPGDQAGRGAQPPVPTNQPRGAGPTAHASPVLLGVGRVDPNSERNDCDTGYQFDFSQQVSMTRPGRVTYRWLRSDSAGAPVEYLDFAEPGTKVATTYWIRGGSPGETIDGWKQIEILTPVSQRGQRITFSHVCRVGPG